jgi:hypothetical protein
MKTISRNLTLGLGAAALCASALPAFAGAFTEPGITAGSPAGFNPPPGLYFANLANYGVAQGASPTGTTSVGIEVPAFTWVPGWNFLGATYSASVAFPFVEIGVHNTTYLRGAFNPDIEPIKLSWNLGNGFAISFAEDIYIPIKSEVTQSSVPAAVTSGAAFEQRVAISYIANDWVISANNIIGITTKDSGGVNDPDYYNLDAMVAHTFGKWMLGVVGYGSWDIQQTPLNTTAFGGFDPGEAIGFGGLLGYNFGPVDIQIRLTHQFITHGMDPGLPKEDTRVWTNIVIPIWNPTPPAPARPVVAKY